jgi:two-component system, chemotaxis family, sensor histidine kinase and response regulator WspE
LTLEDLEEQPAFLELFRSELLINISSIEIHLKQWEKGESIENILDPLIKATHMITGGAKIVQYPLIAELSKAMEEFFGKLQKKSINISENYFKMLFEALNIFQLFSLTGGAKWQQLVIEQTERSTAIINGLKVSDPANSIQTSAWQSIQAENDQSIDSTMLDLFKTEVEAQTTLLNQGLVDFEHAEKNVQNLEALMRAAHSIKGAARVLQLDLLVHLAHAIEDCFVAVQSNKINLLPQHVDIILRGVDLLSKVKDVSQKKIRIWLNAQEEAIHDIVSHIKNQIINQPTQTQALTESTKVSINPLKDQLNNSNKVRSHNRVLRVTAQNLNRLMGLAGESLVESRWLQPFSNSLLYIKKSINEISVVQDSLREILEKKELEESIEHRLVELQHKITECNHNMSERLTELDMFILRHSSLSDRLYREVVDIRMRPFADGIEAFPRMVRDLARLLNKKVRLEIIGKSTPVDRDILDKLEAPLSHLIRNAVDHGIEMPEQRAKSGKPIEGLIKIEAMHRAGMLAIIVSDDGRGIDLAELRNIIIEKKLLNESVAANLTEAELIDFLFLPGFSTRTNVNEISGRGVGLNVVQNMLQEVSGTLRAFANPGKGMIFQLLLPLTLSVIRALIVEVSGEPYAFPLSRIDRATHVLKENIEIIENHQYFRFESHNIGLVHAAQILELKENKISTDELPVIIISDHLNSYGIVVDTFLGERELVVLELNPRLGKIPDISSGALMEDGSPVLIVDTEDLVRSINNILGGGHLHKLGYKKEKSSGN